MGTSKGQERRGWNESYHDLVTYKNCLVLHIGRRPHRNVPLDRLDVMILNQTFVGVRVVQKKMSAKNSKSSLAFVFGKKLQLRGCEQDRSTSTNFLKWVEGNHLPLHNDFAVIAY